MEENQFDNFRKEIKFLLPIYDMVRIENLLAINDFIVQFPKRKITSLYFDDLKKASLFDSIYGFKSREKIRLRYYNNLQDIHLEQKIKEDIFGDKILSGYEGKLIPLNVVELEDYTSKIIDKKIFLSSLVEYDRKYFFKSKENIRITLDYSLRTVDFRTGYERTLNNWFVCEIKLDKSSNFNFPIRRQPVRFSKYAFSKIGFDFKE